MSMRMLLRMGFSYADIKELSIEEVNMFLTIETASKERETELQNASR